MKHLKKLEELRGEIQTFQNKLDSLADEINTEYKKNIKLERNILLKKISEDHNMDYEKLLEQYVYKKNKKHIILSIKKVKGKECFYTKTEGSDVYDEDSNVIGKFANNKIVLNA